MLDSRGRRRRHGGMSGRPISRIGALLLAAGQLTLGRLAASEAGQPPEQAPVGQVRPSEALDITGLLRASANPHYFQDASGKAVLLCGSHTWNTLQDWGTDGRLQRLDFQA